MSIFLLVEARFYPHLNDMLLAGARRAIEAAGHKHETFTVPGALEVPGAIALTARSGRYCAFVGLGVVIRGETYHFEIVSNESARGDPDQLDKGGAAAKAALALYELRAKFAP
jgi:6,7-dimethyl-8-ribityllumazine synthase